MVQKRVLRETLPGQAFQVLENLADAEAATDAADASATMPGQTDQAGRAPAPPGGTHSTEDDAAAADDDDAEPAAPSAKMQLYWRFIVGMLTNQGAMPLAQIAMMLRIVVPGGSPPSDEELRAFLASMVAQRKLEVVRGGAYKLVAG
ncbi:hypothetical protein KEM52_004165 [Ascosphaera acerosa]|nr:hypothetical protein KEM52_004165 [Ascosphaera acerosa]